jgi:hypothetical protein
MMCAIEDAGWTPRDVLCWLWGGGFPKSKACLKPAWSPILLCHKPARRATPLNVDAARIEVCPGTSGFRKGAYATSPERIYGNGAGLKAGMKEYTKPQHPAGRWPANLVLSHVGPGADGEGGCRRVGTKRVRGSKAPTPSPNRQAGYHMGGEYDPVGYAGPDGFEEVEAWECVPGCPVRLLDEQSGETKSPRPYVRSPGTKHSKPQPMAWGERHDYETVDGYGDSGGTSRYFYCSKADRSERWFYCRDCAAAFGPAERPRHLHGHRTAEGKEDWSHVVGHPTQKPESLVRWLVKLISRPGDVVLDPFLGSGTTALACRAEGRACVGVEQDGQYLEIARKRLAGADGPLFARREGKTDG